MPSADSAYALIGCSYSAREAVAAVEALAQAPDDPGQDRIMLAGLAHREESVREASLPACLQRLERLGPEAQARFLRHLLDFCVLDLSPDTQAARSRLLGLLGPWLLERPLDPGLEPHRSRLLSLARDLTYLHGQEPMAELVVRFQTRLAGEATRSDNQVAARLLRLRRFSVYATSGSAESTLLGYLRCDQEVSALALDPEWFAAYRDLLRVQAPGHAPAALLQALQNLQRWLADLTRPLEELQRAAHGVPWEELARPAFLHLVAHEQLLPGAQAVDDLLVLLRTRFTHAGGDQALEAGFRVLACLPGLRDRAGELCAYLGSDGMRTASVPTWSAALDLIGALTTGLSELEPGPALPEQTRRWRGRQEILAADRELRQLLLNLSRNAAMPGEVRRQAWETLLACVPPDRLDLYLQGLQGDLFFPSLAVAGRTHQREVWGVLEALLPQLTADEPGQPRRTRLTQVCTLAERLRPYEAARRGGPLLTLALDDPDPELRQVARNSLHRAGFSAELERELLCRRLLELVQELARVEGQLIELEGQLHELQMQLSGHRSERAGLTLELQEALHQLDLVGTAGWLATADLHLQLCEVRTRLLETLATARDEEGVLRQLQARMEDHLARTHQAAQHIASLVSEEQHYESEVRRLTTQSGQAREAAEATGRQLATLAPPARPSGLEDDPQAARRQFERDLAWFRSRQQGLEDETQRQEQAQAWCENQVRACQAQLQQLASAVAQARTQHSQLARRLDELQGHWQRQRATCQALRTEIRGLTGQVEQLGRDIRDQAAAHREGLNCCQERVTSVTGRLEDVHQRLQAVARDRSDTQQRWQETSLQAQSLAQEICQGRQAYADLAERAARESARADALGLVEQGRAEAFARESQEGLVLAAHSVARARRRRVRRETNR